MNNLISYFLLYWSGLLQGLLFGVWIGGLLEKWIKCEAVEKLELIELDGWEEDE